MKLIINDKQVGGSSVELTFVDTDNKPCSCYIDIKTLHKAVFSYLDANTPEDAVLVNMDTLTQG